MQIIESKDNNKVKILKKLEKKKYREEMGLVLVEGLRTIKQVMDNNIFIDSIYVDEIKYKENKEINDVVSKIKDNVFLIKSNIFSSITDTVNSQGIIAICRKPSWDMESVVNKSFRVLLLDKIQDPGNIGTIIRTADASGYEAIFYTKGTVDVFSQKVSRAAMGINVTLPILEVDIENIKEIKALGYKLFATLLDERAKDYRDVLYPDKMILALGNEANGISEEIKSISDENVYIKIYGSVESLNVSIAGAIVMYESIRNFDRL